MRISLRAVFGVVLLAALYLAPKSYERMKHRQMEKEVLRQGEPQFRRFLERASEDLSRWEESEQLNHSFDVFAMYWFSDVNNDCVVLAPLEWYPEEWREEVSRRRAKFLAPK